MNTCPNCGASNRPTASACRMCGAPLAGATDARGGAPPDIANTIVPTVVFADHNNQQATMNPGNPEGIACPTCQTINEAGWAFCQQCGSKLPQAAPPAAERRDPSAERTVVVQPFGQEPRAPQPSANDPRAGRGMPTVVDKSPDQPAPYADPRRPMGQPTVPDQIPLGQPTVPNQIPYGQPPVPNQAQPAPPASRYEAPEKAQPAPPAGIPGTACPQCANPVAPGNAYCAVCGAAIPVPKTIVMSSVPAPAKGRLHLILEGGGQGEVYDLGDETVIGRTGGDISFPHDGFMSGRHARIVRRGNSFIVEDAGSRNGTFIKINGAVELKPGDMILIGKQLFRFEV